MSGGILINKSGRYFVTRLKKLIEGYLVIQILALNPITLLLHKRPKIKDFWDTNIPLKIGIGIIMGN